MKFTEGGFRDWGYQLAKDEFDAVELDGGPWCTIKNPKTANQIIIKDVIADAMLPPEQYSSKIYNLLPWHLHGPGEVRVWDYGQGYGTWAFVFHVT
mgnify:CR=1 FL=1